MNKNRINALNKASVDTSRYLSLRIDKDNFPDGAEVVVQVRDKMTGELCSLPLSVGDGLNGFFGKHSKFYKQTMADGYTFNPYIHRRFLPSQFRRNMRVAGYDGIVQYVRTHYDWNYVTRFLCDECRKLVMLERRDREAFAERRRFFTLADMQVIFQDYVRAVHQAIDDEVAATPKPQSGSVCVYHIKGMGAIRKDHVRPTKYRFQCFSENVLACRSYAQLSRLLESFDFGSLDRNILVCDRFVNCFLASGAYFTLRYLIMAEGVRLDKGDNVKESLDRLSRYGVKEYLPLYRSLQL